MRRSSTWWLAAAAALALIAGAAVLFQRLRPSDPMARMIALAGEVKTRPVAARISGFPWAPAAAVTRGGEEDTEATLLRLRGAAGEVIERYGTEDSESLYRRGVAYLVAGKLDEAVTTLDRAVQAEPRNARYRNDLSAAQYARASRRNDAEGLSVALATADRAIELDPQLGEARFNRALSLEALGLYGEARKEYTRFLELDGGSAWATEARARLQRLPSREEASVWRRELPLLVAATQRGDLDFVRFTVARFPQQSRRWAEGECLGMWGEAASAPRSMEAAKYLAAARVIGSALAESSGEMLLRDAVAAVDRAEDSGSASIPALAHRKYREGGRLYGRGNLQQALPLLKESEKLFEDARSPMSLVAAYYASNVLTQLDDLAGAKQILDRLESAPRQYQALHASVDWQDATVAGRLGRFHESLRGYEAAFRGFDKLGEAESSARMASYLATSHATLGQFAQAWQLRRSAFEKCSSLGSGCLQQSLAATARWEARRKNWAVARSLLRIATTDEVGHADLPLLADSHIWRALADHFDGAPAQRDVDIRSAESVATRIADLTIREGVFADISFAKAHFLENETPAMAIHLLNRDIAYRTRRQEDARLVEALAARARCRRRLGDLKAAAADLGEAARLIESLHHDIEDLGLRNDFVAARQNVFMELADIFDLLGEPEEAFVAGERGRLRLPAGSNKRILDQVTVKDLVSTVPQDVAIITFSSFSDRLMVAVLKKDRFLSRSNPIAEQALRQHVQYFLASMNGGKAADVSAGGEVLFKVLFGLIENDIEPAERLVVVADSFLRFVPFSALRSPRTGRFLIEDHSIVQAISAALFLRTPQLECDHESALIVVGAGEGPQLPSVWRESKAVADSFDNAKVLDGGKTTADMILRELPRYSHFHFSGHAVLNEIEPRSSHLILGVSDGGVTALYLKDIVGVSSTALHVVFLAACDTAAVGVGEADPRSLALAFHLAGTQNVIGALWRIDDGVSAELTRRFYERLEHRPVADALRETQISMIRSGDAALAAPGSWAGMQLFGSGV